MNKVLNNTKTTNFAASTFGSFDVFANTHTHTHTHMSRRILKTRTRVI